MTTNLNTPDGSDTADAPWNQPNGVAVLNQGEMLDSLLNFADQRFNSEKCRDIVAESLGEDGFVDESCDVDLSKLNRFYDSIFHHFKNGDYNEVGLIVSAQLALYLAGSVKATKRNCDNAEEFLSIFSGFKSSETEKAA